MNSIALYKKCISSDRPAKEAWNEYMEENPNTPVDFSGVKFEGELKDADFSGFNFPGTANFRDAIFTSTANFRNAIFTSTAEFKGATFKGVAEFREATFMRSADFTKATFDAKSSEKADRKGTFTGSARFSAATIANRLDFSTTKFAALPWLQARDGEKYILLPRTPFQFDPLTKEHRMKNLLFGQWTTSAHVVEELRVIRGIAHTINAIDLERDVFILERQAELGVGFQRWWDDKKISHKLVGWVGPFRNIALMMLYRWSANYGRSIVLPAVWIAVLGLCFNRLYESLYASWSGQCIGTHIDKLISDFTRGSLIPFASTTRSSYQGAIDQLFTVNGLVDIPAGIQRFALAHGALDLILIFLIGLAIRNYFRVS